MEDRLEVWPPDARGETAHNDPYYLGWVLRERWLADFSSVFGSDGHAPRWSPASVTSAIGGRTRVPFDDLDAIRAIEACGRLLKAIGSSSVAGTDAIARTVALRHALQPDRPPLNKRQSVSASHRRMRVPGFREQQWDHRFDPHVAPVNDLVDSLIEGRDGRWMPYIPPYHGGIEAEIVLLYQDPGKMTSTVHGGSGFLGCENDDPSAAAIGRVP